MKTYSELQSLARSFINKVANNHPTVGAVVLTWNRGIERTPVASFSHASKDERKVVVHMLRSMADQMEIANTTESQGMMITPAGLLVPKGN